MRPRNHLPLLMTLSAALTCNIAFTKAFAESTHSTATNSSTTKQVFGYYTDWDTYGRGYQPQSIPMSNLTAVLYAFAQIGNCALPYATDDNPTLCNAGAYATGIQDYKLHSADPYSDFNKVPQGYKYAGDNGKGNMAAIINTAHGQNKPAILSILGYSLSVPLTTAIDDQHRAAFIQSIIDFLNTVKADNNGQGFDGIDVDWEPNAAHWTFLDEPNATQQLQNYLTFMTELKAALNKNYQPNSLLTVALPADPDTVNKANQVLPGFWKQLASLVNYMDVMTYDYHGAFDSPKFTNFLAPLKYDPQQPANIPHRTTFNITSTIDAYTAAKVPSSKMIMGIPAYGRAVEHVAAPGLYQAFDDAWDGEWDHTTGTYDYKYIVNTLLKTGGFNEHHYNVAGATGAYSPTAASNQGAWISYDNVSDVKAKVNFVKQNKMAGVMFWSLSGDVGQADPNFKQLSLIYNAFNLLK